MNKFLIIASLTMLFLTGNAFSQKGKPKPSPTPTPAPTPTPTPAPSSQLSVKFEFCGSAADVAACEAENRVRNDSASPYVDGSSGVSAVFYVGGSNDFVLRLDRATRTLQLDFRDAAYLAGAPSWWYSSPQQNVKPQMNVLGAYNAKLACGGAAECDTNFETRFNMGLWKAAGDSKSTFALLWNPSAHAGRPVNPPVTPFWTSAVNVNYVKDATGERYIITPLPSESCTAGMPCETKPYIAGLEKTSGKSVTAAGQYHMPFRMVITVQ